MLNSAPTFFTMKTNKSVLCLVSGFAALAVFPLSSTGMSLDNPASTPATRNAPGSPDFWEQGFKITVSGTERLKNTVLTDLSMKVRCQISPDGSVASVNVIRRGRDRDLNARMLASLKERRFTPQFVQGIAIAHDEVLTVAPQGV
jgi:hypothetical protein